jgi:diadenosine tetraphosphatase ApaH/serine/threonine PP2A family protein phosphatase
MRYAVLSDVHANLEALEVVLADVAIRSPEAIICLGDFVGYGPDPNACVQRLRGVLAGAVVGNHDLAALERTDVTVFNPYARAAILWTRDQLTDDARAYLGDLPPQLRRPAFLAVHGSPRDPTDEYLFDAATAKESFESVEFRLGLVGHTHVPAVFIDDGERVQLVLLASDDPLELRPANRYIINVGSVGQPRDGDPRAAYLWLDEGNSRAQLVRLAYPIGRTQEKMRAAGLPEVLAERLTFGR